MSTKLWGKKSEAMFDYWSFGHILTNLLITKILLIRLTFGYAFLALMIIGYGWEFLERKLEVWPSTKRFFKERECWMNRYVGDILCNITGFLLAWFVI